MSGVHANDSIDYALDEVNQLDLLTEHANFSSSYHDIAIEIE
jgi:hypothetical protein